MSVRRFGRQRALLLLLPAAVGLVLWAAGDPLCRAVHRLFRPRAVMVPAETFVVDDASRKFVYSRSSPLVFVGGMPRSGTTLLRVLLDAHPEVRCGEETRLIPRLLGLKSQWLRAPREANRLREAGVSPQVLDSAIAAFTLEIIARHGAPAARLCNKDPFSLRSAVYLSRLFPNAKFVLMLRDGRAVVHSVISRKVTITGMDLRDYRQCLRRWSSAVQAMWSQCRLLGPRVCLPLHYERLVLHPERTLRALLAFLGLPWDDAVLHHEVFVGSRVSLSILERSTDQVIKPINTEALTKWVGHIPAEVARDMASLAPMLATLGYDPRANPPHYGDPDPLVAGNTRELRANRAKWTARERLVARKRDMVWKGWITAPSVAGNGTASNRTVGSVNGTVLNGGS